ncbi:biotin--protein ligase isoform X2 [Homalodisca vitripennis]|uniref:biotin--protein ligase isoform X2 n=1 Tax=Homalodisca vitripennis TaxID=197043 RepID=UPI001EEC6BB7|nr:biotin--protein ligase isoform X2 [Homalodisca vitripennis]
MLLTVYYMAATWLQSWRLSSMRTKIVQLRKDRGSLLLFKSQESASQQDGLQIQAVNSTYCSNSRDARIGDLLCYSGNKHGVSLFPQLILDTSNWIGVPDKKTLFPIELSGSTIEDLSQENTIHVVIEADFSTFSKQSYASHCQIEEFGVARAWLAHEALLLLLESNEEQLSKLIASYMGNTISIGPGLELLKILSVEVKGKPCLLLNADSIPAFNPSSRRGTSVRKRAVAASQWQSHVSLLQTFSRAAAQAALLKSPAPIEGHRSAMVVPGSGAGYTPMEEVKPFPAESEPQPLEISDPLTVATPTVEELPPLEPEERSMSMTSLSAQPGSTGSSFGSLSRVSTDTLLAASVHSRTGMVNGSSGSMSSLRSITNTPKHIRVTVPHNADTSGKPPNVIVFSESSVSAESVKNTLWSILHKHRYTIYSLSLSQMMSSAWVGQATLVVVCGSVPTTLAPILLQYVLVKGGSLLCLCSDLLGVFLPIFRTAEVRPDQLVTFSYSSWKHVRMMHHIFCYQPASSAKFSSSDETNSINIPKSVEVLDDDNKLHTLSVKVLGAEETWQTPSLLLGTENQSGGRVVFSQVHLEADPSQYESDEDKAKALKESNPARIEIFSDLLSTHLGLDCSRDKTDTKYSAAYFLGSHELKQEFMNKIKTRLEGGNTLKLPDLTLKFCGKGVSPPEASSSLLPVLMYACPDSFSTVSYFDNLESKTLGRLVIFSSVMTTAMAVLTGPPLAHGLAVIPSQQTSGVGRGGNMWLSPEGCAMFAFQLHIPLKSELGRLLPFLQHTVALAIVSSVCSQPGLEVLELGLKWPNDIYAGALKVGGLIVTSVISNACAICNVGCGFNLDNKFPTVCINDMITQLNKASGQKLPLLTKEKFFAIVFNQLEKLLLMIELGEQDKVLEMYYKYWLHGGAEVDVTGPDGTVQHVTIVGIDEYGFLRVQAADRSEFTVQPDGNSFDMLAGLIAPKVK